VKPITNAFKRFRFMAYITGVVLAVLTVWLILGYGLMDYANTDQKPVLYGWLWTAHGWLYFAYLIVGVDLAFRMRFGILKTVGILVAGTIPFMSFVAEHFVRRDVEEAIATAMPN
jgi:integral membrane protein